MKPYADTNVFTAAHLQLGQTADALAMMEELRKSHGSRLPVTALLRMEFTNALQRLFFEARKGNQVLRLTPEHILLAEDAFFEELRLGAVTRTSPLTIDSLEPEFEKLAHRHTARYGFRTYDILHVASALALGCDTFWTFDTKARKLAKLEGLATN